MALEWPSKDPDEVLDYTVDWTARLGTNDTIISSEWPDPPTGIIVDSDNHDTTSSVIWLSGGTLNEAYTFVNRVVTAGGRTMDQSVKLKIKTR
jgi:hypothetical protein